MKINRISGQGIGVMLSSEAPTIQASRKAGDYYKIRLTQSGDDCFSHENQQLILQYLGDFLPRVVIRSNDGSTEVFYQMLNNGTEIVGDSIQLKDAKDLADDEIARLNLALQAMKARLNDPATDPTRRNTINGFRLPNPDKDPEFYRISKACGKKRLIVLWGLEKEPGSSLIPHEAVSTVIASGSTNSAAKSKSSVLLPILAILFICALGYYGYSQWNKTGGDFKNNEKISGNGSANSAPKVRPSYQADPAVAQSEDRTSADGNNTDGPIATDTQNSKLPKGDQSDLATAEDDGIQKVGRNDDLTSSQITKSDDNKVNNSSGQANNTESHTIPDNGSEKGNGVASNDPKMNSGNANENQQTDEIAADSETSTPNAGKGDNLSAASESKSDKSTRKDTAIPSIKSEQKSITQDESNNQEGDSVKDPKMGTTDTPANAGDANDNSDLGVDGNSSPNSESNSEVSEKKLTKNDLNETTENKDLIVIPGPVKIPKDSEINSSTQQPRPAERKEINTAKIIRPAVVTIAVGTQENGYEGQGTGFFISSSGLIVTSAHVVEGMDEFVAITAAGHSVAVKKIKSDAKRDLALLAASKQSGAFPFLKLGEANSGVIGGTISVMGSPQGLSNTYTTGIVSAARQDETIDFVQITAPVSPGSSGSPVVDADSLVIGIVKGGMDMKSSQSLNFAIDVGELHEMLGEIRSSGKIEEKKVVKNVQEGVAENTKNPSQQPDASALAKKPDAPVAWKPDQQTARNHSPSMESSSPNQSTEKPKKSEKINATSGSIQVVEVSRKLISDKKMELVLQVKFLTKDGNLESLSELGCSANGVELAVNKDNVILAAQNGKNVLKITGKDLQGEPIKADININMAFEFTSDVEIEVNQNR